jgi:hypothetical protein
MNPRTNHIASGKLAKTILKDENISTLNTLLAPFSERHTPGTHMLLAAADWAENQLEKAGVARADRPGCRMTYRSPGATAKSYKYGKHGPTYDLKRSSTGWTIVAIGYHSPFPQVRKIERVQLTEEAMASFVRASLQSLSFVAPTVKTAA